MTGCAEWMDSIAGCALGDPVDPALAAHLADCPACTAALREASAAAARMDEALARRAAVEPPFYGPERVMARIGEPHRADSPGWWKWAAVGSAAVLLLAALLLTPRPAARTDVTALSAWRSPTEALLRPPVGAVWKAMPRLGEGFFEIKLSGETHAQ